MSDAIMSSCHADANAESVTLEDTSVIDSEARAQRPPARSPRILAKYRSLEMKLRFPHTIWISLICFENIQFVSGQQKHPFMAFSFALCKYFVVLKTPQSIVSKHLFSCNGPRLLSPLIVSQVPQLT